MMIPSNKIRLTNFLKLKYEDHTPIFWEGQAILTRGSFNLVITEMDDPLWGWEGQIHYQDECIYRVKGNCLSDDFLESIVSALQEVGLTYLENWEEKLHEIVDYLDRQHGVALTSSNSIYRPSVSSLTAYSWVDGEWPSIKARIEVVATEISEPSITLDAINLEKRYIYSVSLEDTKYKEVIDTYFEEIKSILV